jgi:hypothetical protein
MSDSQKNINYQKLTEIKNDLREMKQDTFTIKNDIKIIKSLLQDKEEQKQINISSGWSIMNPFRM